MIFVFGSNLAGRHGAGAALYAVTYRGAIYGQGKGPQGRSYAIPTKDAQLKPLPLTEIEKYVGVFIEYARAYPDQLFDVTRVGCGYAGYKDEQIAPLFRDAPDNCLLPDLWYSLISPKGT